MGFVDVPAFRENRTPAGHIHQLRLHQTCDDGKQSIAGVSGVLRHTMKYRRIRHEKQASREKPHTQQQFEGRQQWINVLKSQMGPQQSASSPLTVTLQRRCSCQNRILSLILNFKCTQGKTHMLKEWGSLQSLHLFVKLVLNVRNEARTCSRRFVLWTRKVNWNWHDSNLVICKNVLYSKSLCIC